LIILFKAWSLIDLANERRKEDEDKKQLKKEHIKMISSQTNLSLQRNNVLPKTQAISQSNGLLLAAILPGSKRREKHVFGAVGRQRKVR
jgi:NACalpha-BTF3-like transcription factor